MRLKAICTGHGICKLKTKQCSLHWGGICIPGITSNIRIGCAAPFDARYTISHDSVPIFLCQWHHLQRDSQLFANLRGIEQSETQYTASFDQLNEDKDGIFRAFNQEKNKKLRLSRIGHVIVLNNATCFSLKKIGSAPESMSKHIKTQRMSRELERRRTTPADRLASHPPRDKSPKSLQSLPGTRFAGRKLSHHVLLFAAGTRRHWNLLHHSEAQQLSAFCLIHTCIKLSELRLWLSYLGVGCTMYINTVYSTSVYNVHASGPHLIDVVKPFEQQARNALPSRIFGHNSIKPILLVWYLW